jgi:hypothetical protein
VGAESRDGFRILLGISAADERREVTSLVADVVAVHLTAQCTLGILQYGDGVPAQRIHDMDGSRDDRPYPARTATRASSRHAQEVAG